MNAEGWTKVDEIPDDFQRRRLTIVAAAPAAGAGEEGGAGAAPAPRHRIVTKGAFANVPAVRTKLAGDGGTRAIGAAVPARARDAVADTRPGSSSRASCASPTRPSPTPCTRCMRSPRAA